MAGKRLRRISKVFIIFTALILVVTGCSTKSGGDTTQANPIKIGIIGPMQFTAGQNHWMGATLAADEINAAGGIQVGDKKRKIELVKGDTNELLNITDATNTVERLLTVDKVNFLVGGYRGEAVIPMMELAADNKTMFLGVSTTAPISEKVAKDYERYKYWFRITPVDSASMGQMLFAILNEGADAYRKQLNIQKPKVAILAEQAIWADPIVEAAKTNLPKMGMEVVGVWRPSSTATNVKPELTAIKDSGADIIFVNLAGPVGITFAKQWGELKIPALPVGGNAEAQTKAFWDATGGGANYNVLYDVYARIAITEKTIPFWDKFVAKFDAFPLNAAGTYDALYVLKDAIEKTNSTDANTLIKQMEGTEYITTGSKLKFTANHDVTFGPGYFTGLGTQWIDGKKDVVWPNGWKDVKYPGAKSIVLPPWVIERYKK